MCLFTRSSGPSVHVQRGGGESVALVVGEGRGRDHVIDNGYQPGSDPSAPPDAELVVEQLGSRAWRLQK